MAEKLDIEQLHKTGEFTTTRREKDMIITGRYTFSEEKRTVDSVYGRIDKLKGMHETIDTEIERLTKELKG